MKLPDAKNLQEAWPTYQNNFARHVIGVARFLQADIMATLINTDGHTALRLSFEPFISQIQDGGASLTQIADALGISKQAANQTINQIEEAGYIQRIASATDKRSKVLKLTPLGDKLVHDGMLAYEQTESRIKAAAPNFDFDALKPLLATLISEFGITPESQEHLHFGVLLPRLSDYINARLMMHTESFGHPGLKLSFAHVLSQIGPMGSRVQDIVRVRKISKQAVSNISQELEELGYIHRKYDKENGRQQIIFFTEMGVDLICDSLTSTTLLEEEFTSLLGNKNFQKLKKTFSHLYFGLDLAQEEFGVLYKPELHTIAKKINRELGNEKALELARILLSMQPK